LNLLPLLDASLLGRATRAALEFGGASFSFGELEARSNRTAQCLRARGLARGDRVAFFLQNRVEVIDLWLAAVKTGVVLVPVNVLYRERELKHILADAEPRAVVTSRDLAGFVPAGVEIWDVGALAADAAKLNADRVVETCEADTPLALIYTSGTTGASKGAVLTHGNFAANGATLARDWRFSESDRLLCTLPLFHVHGLANAIHCWLMSGCHLRLTERFEHARAAEWFDDYRPTVFFGVPAMFIRLLELVPEIARAIGARLRLAVSGSAPLPAEVHEKFRQLYGSVILERYGMTETLMNVGNPYDGERRPFSVM
jgi:malonyl-CoA/methylmalonyl-CoA synthetase